MFLHHHIPSTEIHKFSPSAVQCSVVSTSIITMGRWDHNRKRKLIKLIKPEKVGLYASSLFEHPHVVDDAPLTIKISIHVAFIYEMFILMTLS